MMDFPKIFRQTIPTIKLDTFYAISLTEQDAIFSWSFSTYSYKRS